MFMAWAIHAYWLGHTDEFFSSCFLSLIFKILFGSTKNGDNHILPAIPNFQYNKIGNVFMP